MDFSLLYLALLATLVMFRPLLAAGFLLTFTEATIWPVMSTTARNFSLFMLVAGTAWQLLRNPTESIQRMRSELANNPLLHIFFLLGAFYFLGRRPVEDVDQIAAKRLLIYAIIPLICSVALLRDKRGIGTFLGGLILGLFSQTGFEYFRYGLQLDFMSADELRMGLGSTGNSHMLYSGWLAMCSIIGVYMQISLTKLWARIVGVGLGVVSIVLLLYTGTRSGLFAAVIGITVIILGARKYWYGIAAAVALLIAVTYYGFAGNSVMALRLAEFWDKPLDASADRLELYMDGLFVDFPKYWVLGTGTLRSGDVRSVTIWDRNRGPYASDVFYRINYENMPITFLVELGVLGFGLLGLIVLRFIHREASAFVHRPRDMQFKDYSFRMLCLAFLFAAAARGFLYGTLNGATDLFVAIMLLHSCNLGLSQAAQPTRQVGILRRQQWRNGRSAIKIGR